LWRIPPALELVLRDQSYFVMGAQFWVWCVSAT
jgi:hypothetical protein